MLTVTCLEWVACMMQGVLMLLVGTVALNKLHTFDCGCAAGCEPQSHVLFIGIHMYSLSVHLLESSPSDMRHASVV